jgi:hypothetical protein
MKKITLSSIITGVIAFVLGWFLKDYSVTPMSTSISSSNAHTYSKYHRLTSTGYCKPLTDSEKQYYIDPMKEGYFKITLDQVRDLRNACEKISNNTIPSASNFHCIFGKKTADPAKDNSLLMVVGLDPKGLEIFKSPEGENMIQEVDQILPCPGIVTLL